MVEPATLMQDAGYSSFKLKRLSAVSDTQAILQRLHSKPSVKHPRCPYCDVARTTLSSHDTITDSTLLTRLALQRSVELSILDRAKRKSQSKQSAKILEIQEKRSAKTQKARDLERAESLENYVQSRLYGSRYRSNGDEREISLTSLCSHVSRSRLQSIESSTSGLSGSNGRSITSLRHVPSSATQKWATAQLMPVLRYADISSLDAGLDHRSFSRHFSQQYWGDRVNRVVIGDEYELDSPNTTRQFSKLALPHKTYSEAMEDRAIWQDAKLQAGQGDTAYVDNKGIQSSTRSAKHHFRDAQSRTGSLWWWDGQTSKQLLQGENYDHDYKVQDMINDYLKTTRKIKVDRKKQMLASGDFNTYIFDQD